ncbi:MAG: M36 family metallopeptidase [Flavobacteriales bacterium]|nr:M36 family metallopeptidase [Flavobacteriales bacterium]MCB9193587.1 M36 family metallopeptidase [Flavobacteriales bacterium]
MNLNLPIRSLMGLALISVSTDLLAQSRPSDPIGTAREVLVASGVNASDLTDLVLKDRYSDRRTGVVHMYLRQRLHGVEIWGADIGVHLQADGSPIGHTESIVHGLRTKEAANAPSLTPEQALQLVMQREGLGGRPLERIAQDDRAHRYSFSGEGITSEDPAVQLYYVQVNDHPVLCWNVELYVPKGPHWWNIRIDANTGKEIDRNDWVAHCAFDAPPAPLAPPVPPAPNDYDVFAMPLESPSHGPRSIVNAPWNAALNASPFGWHDTDGIAGAEFTITRGNNVYASEDRNNDNVPGYSPDGGAALDFDFPLDLAQSPIDYEDVAITNLFYWNNIVHDVAYQYGFDEASGNFQENNYGNGGLGGDYVNADAQDGSGTDNANFGTPPDGSNPRMQMYEWTYTTPHRDSDLDAGVIVHEYTHGISNRLVGGPSNANCLSNAEQMGEGWSDYVCLMLTMQPGDQGTDARGIGTYVLGEPVTGDGIRPAPYSTDFGVNAYTYGNTNSGVSQPHGIGFVWCTILWEVTWDLITQYGYDPDIYTGTGGNNIALQLVLDGMKLTPCSPGFVDARDAILLADQNDYGGANQDLLWAAFARRGLGYSADQGSSSSRSDQVEAFDLPLDNDVGIRSALYPTAGYVYACQAGSSVSVRIGNHGQLPQSNIPLSYRLDNGPVVSDTYAGTINGGGETVFSFPGVLTVSGTGVHHFKCWTSLATDEYLLDDTLAVDFEISIPQDPPVLEDAEDAQLLPEGWTLQNPDGSYTWELTALDYGPDCNATEAWMLDHYFYSGSGQEDALQSALIDLSGMSEAALTFDHAYVRYSSFYSDGFRVEISADCGLNWDVLFDSSGTDLETAATTTSVWEPSSCSDWQHDSLDISAYVGQQVLVRFVSENGYGNQFYMDNIAISGTGLSVPLRVVLEGPYDAGTGLMHDDLRANGLLPLTEPYTGLGYTFVGEGGSEAVDAGVLAASGNDAIVDWVIVELRDATDPSVVVNSRAALLQRDGDVVGMDGSGPLTFGIAPGEYHVAVRHRNHLGCMTAAAVDLTPGMPVIDLTSSGTVTYGTDARKDLGGTMVLWAGNVVSDATLKYANTNNDRDPILVRIGGTIPTNTATGYYQEDVTLDGVVKYANTNNDRDPILVNIGGSIPTAVRTEQLP